MGERGPKRRTDMAQWSTGLAPLAFIRGKDTLADETVSGTATKKMKATHVPNRTCSMTSLDIAPHLQKTNLQNMVAAYNQRLQ